MRYEMCGATYLHLDYDIFQDAIHHRNAKLRMEAREVVQQNGEQIYVAELYFPDLGERIIQFPNDLSSSSNQPCE